jgi:hypothetical protein
VVFGLKIEKFKKKMRNKILRVKIITALSILKNTIEGILVQ